MPCDVRWRIRRSVRFHMSGTHTHTHTCAVRRALDSVRNRSRQVFAVRAFRNAGRAARSRGPDDRAKAMKTPEAALSCVSVGPHPSRDPDREPTDGRTHTHTYPRAAWLAVTDVNQQFLSAPPSTRAERIRSIGAYHRRLRMLPTAAEWTQMPRRRHRDSLAPSDDLPIIAIAVFFQAVNESVTSMLLMPAESGKR